MKKIKRVSVIILTVIFISSFFAIPVHAIDPVSATAIANGFAQAITAYGAANGVSLTFDGIDSNNTNQIGEAIHDMWSRFRAGQQTTDDYLAIGEALMPTLFYKAEKAAGAAAIGISIAPQFMDDIDDFWNWLLSGPAEMVKVDNAYQWNVVNGEIPAKPVFNYLDSHIGVVSAGDVPATLWEKGTKIYRRATSGTYNRMYSASAVTDNVFVFLTYNGSNYTLFFASPANTTGYYSYRSINNSGEYTDSYGSGSAAIDSYSSDYHLYYTSSVGSSTIANYFIPVYSDRDSGLAALSGLIDENEPIISVQPYVGDAVAKPVPIPDTSDPDYGPVPWVGDLDIPWDDTLFGDGTGVLSDAQTDSIVSSIDNAIIDNPAKTIELFDNPALNPDLPASEVFTPLLPIELPDFDFSFSGIWHYVREWVSSLGSWFALVFTVWSYLPYALVVPVYATAVIVIVLGVYKRFFM